MECRGSKEGSHLIEHGQLHYGEQTLHKAVNVVLGQFGMSWDFRHPARLAVPLPTQERFGWGVGGL